MTKIAPETEAEAEDSDFKPLTAQEAHEWRRRHPAVSVWRLVGMQAVAGVLVSLVAWAVSGEVPVAWSAGYGALAVVLPAALFARGMARQKRAVSAGSAMVGFFGWEMVKIALTVAMLAAAPVAGVATELAGVAGGHGGNDENVLDRTHGAAWCPKTD